MRLIGHYLVDRFDFELFGYDLTGYQSKATD